MEYPEGAVAHSKPPATQAELGDPADFTLSNAWAAAYVGLAVAATVAGALLAASGAWLPWLFGQLLWAVAFLEWFLVLHEAGHQTLFTTRRANRVVGQLAAVFALIPFCAWRAIHARHHKWTGWQDRDATTATLLPRPLPAWQRFLIEVAWKTGLPLFSITYRMQNYWGAARLAAFVSAPLLRRIRIEAALLATFYAAVLIWFGPIAVLAHCGVGLLLALMAEDVILLSQHTGMPSHVAGPDATVAPFPPLAQETFTRTLRLPAMLSALIMHFDRHELHHMYPAVPGYRLARIAYRPRHEVAAWTWLRQAKRQCGTRFLFERPPLVEPKS